MDLTYLAMGELKRGERRELKEMKYFGQCSGWLVYSSEYELDLEMINIVF